MYYGYKWVVVYLTGCPNMLFFFFSCRNLLTHFLPMALVVPGHIWNYRIFERYGLKGTCCEIVFKQMPGKSQKRPYKTKVLMIWFQPLPLSSVLASVYFWILGTGNLWEMKNRKYKVYVIYSLIGYIVIWNSVEEIPL